MAINGICANAHDLGIVFGELAQIASVRRHLPGSGRAPVQGIKRHQRVLFTPQITELEFLPLLARDCGKFEIRGSVTCLQSYHSDPPSWNSRDCSGPCREENTCRAEQNSFYRGQMI